MTRYEVLGPGYSPYDSRYEYNSAGEVLPRQPTPDPVKKVLDQIRARERSIERFARWVNNRE